MTLATPSNPLLAPPAAAALGPPALAPASANSIAEAVQKTVDLGEVDFATMHRRPVPEKRRLMLLWRREAAEVALRDFDQALELFAFTKGQFSLLDLLKAVLKKTGPAEVALSTWTANRQEALELTAMLKAGTITTMRWLVDLTFVRRDPEAAQAIRLAFGVDSIRVANCHSKFATFGNAAWKVVLRTSMNLNMNPRTEDFNLAHDPALYAFVQDMLARVWKHQPGGLDHHRPYDIHKLFAELT